MIWWWWVHTDSNGHCTTWLTVLLHQHSIIKIPHNTITQSQGHMLFSAHFHTTLTASFLLARTVHTARGLDGSSDTAISATARPGDRHAPRISHAARVSEDKPPAGHTPSSVRQQGHIDRVHGQQRSRPSLIGGTVLLNVCVVGASHKHARPQNKKFAMLGACVPRDCKRAACSRQASLVLGRIYVNTVAAARDTQPSMHCMPAQQKQRQRDRDKATATATATAGADHGGEYGA